MLNAILAALCMVAVDILNTIMVQAEAGSRGWLAGIMDTLGWYPAIVCTTLCVVALDGPSLSDKVAVLTLVGVANLFGTKAGQIIGTRLLARLARKRAGLIAPPKTPEERLDYLERLLGVKRG